MNDKIIFSVSPRTLAGKQVKQLRKQKLVPANIYGIGKDSMPVQCVTSDFRRLYDKVGETSVVYLQIKGEKTEKPVLIDEVQVDPVDNSLIHVAFKQVDLSQKIEATIPIEMVGEFELSGAVLVSVRDSVLVEALPTDLPEKFEVDVSTLKAIGDMITVGDLAYDKEKVTLVEFENEEELLQEPIVVIQEHKEEVVEETTPQEVVITGEAEKKEEATSEGDKSSDTTKSSAE